MNLTFESWVQQQSFVGEAKELFKEAFICYKANACRAAMLFSYLGFQTILRDRILRASKPSGLDTGRWNKIQSDVRNDDKWDSAVFDAVQQGHPKEIFTLNEDLRNQVKYFKNRRNDCAHGKYNKIDFSHVETFWLFISSNLSRFAVHGSRDELINQIKDQLDPSITPPGSTFKPIIQEIPNVVEPDNLGMFFAEIHSLFGDSPPTFPVYTKQEAELFNCVFDLKDERVVEAAISFLKKNEYLLVTVFQEYPNRVHSISEDAPLTRKLWYECLPKATGGILGVFAALLRNGLIPKEQKNEAISHTIKNISSEVPDRNTHSTLEEHGFFTHLKSIAFEERLMDDFGWGNKNRHLVVYYLDHFEMDEQVAEGISWVFCKSNHPFELRWVIDSFFAENPSKKEQFEEAIERYDLPSPSALTQLT